MATGLVLPGQCRPSNLILPEGARVELVEADLYNICNRIREELEHGERLFVILQEDHPKPWVVMEHADDGTDMMVLRAEELDGRIIADLRYMLSVPLSKRLDAIEAMEARHEEQRKSDELDELYENLGRPMWSQLEHDGFIETRPRSYPKRGVATPGRR